MNCFAICWLWRNWYSLLTLTLRCVRLFQTIHPPHTLEFTRSGYVFDGILSEVAGVAEGEGGEELIISSFLFGRCWNIKSRWWVNTGKIRDSSHSSSFRVNSITFGEFSEWQERAATGGCPYKKAIIKGKGGTLTDHSLLRPPSIFLRLPAD